MTLLVSACLLGLPCRYDGAAKPAPQVLELMAEHRLIPVCPEQLGGLPTPRPECPGAGPALRLPGSHPQGAQPLLRLRSHL